jgi:PIN domain nuclease of toxin-antitoxin system
MRLLLDSHAFLWFIGGNASLSTAARTAIEDNGNEKYVSHATAWEVAIKVSLSKLKLQVGYHELFPGALLANGFRELAALNFQHFEELLNIPMHHRDPFDRILIAQARVEGMSVLSCDPRLAAYEVPLIW